jgi:hypothetical protein
MPIQATVKMREPQTRKSWLSRSEILQARLRDLEIGAYYQARHQERKINNGRDIG